MYTKFNNKSVILWGQSTVLLQKIYFQMAKYYDWAM